MSEEFRACLANVANVTLRKSLYYEAFCLNLRFSATWSLTCLR
jgi:hypothetical protein